MKLEIHPGCGISVVVETSVSGAETRIAFGPVGLEFDGFLGVEQSIDVVVETSVSSVLLLS